MSLFIAAQPKSGSTHVEVTLRQTLQWLPAESAHSQHKHLAEQDICTSQLIRLRSPRVVFRQHLRAWPRNVAQLVAAGLPTIVTHRNVYDSVVSMTDHLERDEPMIGILPPADFKLAPRELRRMWVIRQWVPWYFEFLNSWREAEARLPLLWVDYDMHHRDQIVSFRKVLDWVGEDTPENAARLEEFATEQKWRFNVGRPGRGLEELDDADRREIVRIGAGWPIHIQALAGVEV